MAPLLLGVRNKEVAKKELTVPVKVPALNLNLGLEGGAAADDQSAAMRSSSHRDGPVDAACCLFWMVGGPAQAGGASQLLAVHSEMVQGVRQAGVEVLEDSAASCLVKSAPRAADGMSAEDVALRLGELLCQWAKAQQPPIPLCVGVHTGKLTSFVLPSTGRSTYTGEAVVMCKHLVLSADQDRMVHFSDEVRGRLQLLGAAPVLLSRQGSSYILDSGADAAVEADPLDKAKASGATLSELVDKSFVPSAKQARVGPGSVGIRSVGNDQHEPAGDGGPMSLPEFTKHLEAYDVDIAEFGQGDAKTLQEFYNEVMVDQESYLTVTGKSLERVVEIVRMQLLMRGDDNRLRELRISAQAKADGTVRRRNQRLAMVMRPCDDLHWKDAAVQCLERKFGLGRADQRKCLSFEWDTYALAEERLASRTVPDIMTIYKVHSVTVTVRDKGRPELAALGLPLGLDFTTQRGTRFWSWAPVANSREDMLIDLLKTNGINISEFPAGAFADLYDEVYEKCQSTLQVVDRELVRKVRVVKLWLHADILAVDHVLLLGSKVQRGKSDTQDKGRPLTMKMPLDGDWKQAVETVLLTRLGMTKDTQLSCIAVDEGSYKEDEMWSYSSAFPGLKTCYRIDEVTARVVLPGGGEVDASTLHRIGLPDGQNFAFSRWEPAKGPGKDDLVITHWQWQSAKDLVNTDSVNNNKTAPLAKTYVEARLQRRRHLVPDVEAALPAPKATFGCVASPRSRSGMLLESLMKGRKMDMKRARRAASRICDPRYSCKDFYEDITAAFPELGLYLCGDMTSGRAGEDEYQRTLGAMFCFFWMMRLHLDGAHSFCFGLDENWKPRQKPYDNSSEALAEWERRSAFHRDAEWASLELLLVNAGLLEEATPPELQPARKRSFLELASKRAYVLRKHDVERTLAMLVLTAIHDIMKTVQLLPTVSKKHGTFRGYKVGEMINDHDAALAYILEHYPSVLPSYAALSREQQESIKFTQSKMEYNMGWLVQAEAPPGALFRKFKRVIESGQASPQDLAFYFTHWFTDLAGAEPFPTEGCEKFVLRFPKHVLNQFLLSFSIVQSISAPGATEAKVYEDYLQWRWDSHKPALGPAPMGKGSIAKMRLVVMAQGDSEAIVRAFDALPEEDMEVLSTEMSMVDIWKQSWSRERSEFRGPAILVYYAPALMQKAGKQDPHGALLLLADVFRQARALWPLSEAAGNWWVSVRVDQLKELTVREIRESNPSKVWAVTKLTSREGAVQRMSLLETRTGDWDTNHRVLDVGDRGAVEPHQRETAVAAAEGDPEGQVHSI